MEKDYYAILGISPKAEEIVIRAAYRALVQKYHPDRYTGVRAFAEERMRLLNEAHGVLSDSARRKAYDSEQRLTNDGLGAMDDETTSEDATFRPLDIDNDWMIACSFHPEIKDLEARLRRTSFPLAYAFARTILERKNFRCAADLASSMEDEFLTRYFGRNQSIRRFAVTLIRLGKRQSLAVLNSITRVLGHEADPLKVMQHVVATAPDLPESSAAADEIRAAIESERFLRLDLAPLGEPDVEPAVRILERRGGSARLEVSKSRLLRWLGKGRTVVVTYRDRTFVCDPWEFWDYVRNLLLESDGPST